MTTYGIVPEGFLVKPLSVIIAEMEEVARDEFGADINTQPDSVLGVLFGIFGDKIFELWNAQLAVYRAGQADSALDEAQDALYALNGITRLAAAESSVLARVNLAAGTTLPLGSTARIGTDGEEWITQAAVTNVAAYEDTIFVDMKSSNLGPIVGNAYSIDSIAVPVAGWTAKAAVNTLNSEPFALVNGQTLQVEVDEGAAQLVTFLAGDFAAIGTATAAEIASAINTATTGLTALDAGGTVRIKSDTDGPGSAIQIVAGDSREALGFPIDLIKGMNPSRSAKILGGNAEPFALVDGQKLFLKIDKGSTQTITFSAGDFAAIGTATAIETAKAINLQLVDGLAYEVGGKVQIESLLAGVNSAVEITGGDSNIAIGFEEDAVQLGSAGDADIGRNTETNSAFRIRRERLLRRAGSAMVEGIRADLFAVDDVIQAFVYENPTDFLDADGRPPHSIECVIVGGTDADVATAIFLSKAAGIETYRVPGANGRTEIVTDSNGVTHTINFNRPEDVQMYVEVDVSVNKNIFGAGDQPTGEQLVKDAIKAIGDAFEIGDDVIASRLLCAPFSVPGVVDVASLKVEDIFPPANTANFAIEPRQLARFSTVDIVVNVAFA